MTEPQKSFKELPEGAVLEPPKSFKELPEGALLEAPKSLKELPEDAVLEDDLSIDEIKKMQSEGVKLSEKLQRKLFKADDERTFMDKVSGAAGAFIPAAADIIGQTASGAVELANKAVVQPAAFALSGGYGRLDSEEAKKVFKEREEAIRSLGVGAAKDIEETVNAAVRFGMFGSATTDKLLGKSYEERFRAWQDRQIMRQLEAQEAEQNPDRVAALLSQNPLIQGYVEYEAKKMGLSPEEVEKVKQDYIQTMLDQGLTKDQINQNISALGEFVSPVAIPGGGRLSGAVLKPLSKVTAPVMNKAGDLAMQGTSKLAAGTEYAANKVLQGTELLQTGARKIGEYAVNDPDTWIKGTVNTAILPVVSVAKPVSSTARVIKDITKQADIGGTAGRMGMVERAGKAIDSSDLTKRLFGTQGKGGVARAKLADWTIRQSNALIQPGVNAAAMNVVMGLPDIETAEDLGFSAGTGFGIGSLAGTRSYERIGGLIDPRTTMAQKITNLVTPDPAAYRRDEDADIKRFMAQASPEIQKNIADLSNIESRKAAVEAAISNLEKERDAQIDPDDAAFKQKQIDGFIKQREALAKATPETQAEATRQTTLAFIDAYDLAQSTGGVAGLRGVKIAVLDPANADQFFRDLYGDSLKQAETTINLLTGIPSLTETDSQKLTEARQLLQKFQNDVEGAKSARGFALQEDDTDPNSANFVPPHLRRVNQQGATAVINADLIKHMTSQGLNLRHTLQHEVQHAVQQFAEVNRMLAPLRGQLFDQKIKNDDGTTEVYQQGLYSDEDLNRYAARYANLMSPNDNGASFYAQFGVDSEKMRAYIKDEILAEIAAATGEYAGGTRASLDDVGRNVMDWFEVKTKSGRLKQLKETLRKNGILFDNAGEYSAILGAKISPETLSMVRQYQRGLKDFDGTMAVQQSRESDEPDIPLNKVLESVALQNKYKHADFFEKEQIIKATAPDGSVTEIVIPEGAKIDPFIDVYRTQNGQLVDADGNVVTLGPEITFGSMPDGTTFEVDTRIDRKPNGSPIILTNREMKARALERTKMIQNAIDSAKNDGSGVRLSDTGNGNYRGVMSPAQIEAFMALPNHVVSPNLKRMTKFFNELMAKNDGTRVVLEYQAALLNGKYKALSPKIRDEVPIGFQLTKDGNFALTTISVSRLYDKMQAWADKKPENLQPWNGDTGAFWNSLIKLLDNHSRGEKGETGLHPDAYIAGKMKNKINDLFNAYNAETKQSNPDRSTLPRARGKDNLDIVIRSRRLDRINNFSESPSQKLPINYGYLTTNYMPAVNPMAAPMTAEEVQNRFDGSVTATRVRRAMATGEVDALESELRQMDDLLPTESLQLVQGEDQMPRIQIVSMFDPENVASLEPEEIVSDIDAETEAELAILDAQDGTVPPQDIAKVLSTKLDQLYADGGRSPIIPTLESELEKIYQQLESQAQEQEAATEDVVEAPEVTEVDIMNSPTDLIAQAVEAYNTGKVDNATQTLPEYIRSVVNEAGALQIPPDVTDEQIMSAVNDAVQSRDSLKQRIQGGTQFMPAGEIEAPSGERGLHARLGFARPTEQEPTIGEKTEISPKIDANYMKAVDSGDVEAQKKLVDEAVKASLGFPFMDSLATQTRAASGVADADKQINFYQKILSEEFTPQAEELAVIAAEENRKKWIENGLNPDDFTPDQFFKALDLGLDPIKNEQDVRQTFEVNRKGASENIKKYEASKSRYSGQPTETPFKTGESFVTKVYHATPFGRLTTFDAEKLGSFTGAPSATKAHFFAGDPEVSETYFGDDALYLKHQGFLRLTGEQKTELINYLRNEVSNDLDSIPDNEVKESALMLFENLDNYDTTPIDNTLHEVYVALKNPLVYDFKGSSYREQSFSDLIDKAIQEGRDGVVFANTFDPGPAATSGSYSPPTNVIAVIAGNETKIKSADPVTYDDEGNVIPLSQRFQTTSPDIRFMPAGEGLPLSDATAPERQQQVEKPLSMVRLSDAPEPPKKYAFAYTTSSDRIPLVDAFVKAKNWQAIRDLNQATIRHAMSDLPSVKYTMKDLVGAFENEREISVMPEFEINSPEELAEVRKRMVSLGELWQQTEVLEEQVGGGDQNLLGTVDNDGYLHIGKAILTFDKLTPALVEKARQASGIQAMSYDNNSVIFYDTDNNETEFGRRIREFRDFITKNGRILEDFSGDSTRVRSYRNPNSPKAGSLYYNEDPIRLFGEGQLPDRLRSPVYRVVSELLGRPLPPPKDGRASYFVKEDVTPKQVKLQNAIANKQAAVVLNDKKNKDVIKAYEELNAELLKQFDALVAAGMTFNAAPDYDAYNSLYPDSASVIRDIRNNNNLVYLKTTPETFGPIQNGKRMDFSFHPILKDSGRTDASGNKMSYNDILRVVHDAIAHGIYSAQFGPVGEESAWNTHIRTIDNPWARWALTMETRAQNSWVNYQDKFLTEKKTGEDRMPLKKGDKGFIPITQRDYAEQKFALIPLKYVLTGDAKVDKPVKDLMEEIGEKRADGSPEKDPEWMPSKKEREKIYASIKQPQGTPKDLLKQASDVIGKLTRKDDAENVPVIVEKAWAEKKSKDEDAEDGTEDGVEDGEVITTSTAVLKDVVAYSLRGTPIVVRPLPNLLAENVKTKVSKNVLAIAEDKKKYLEYSNRVLTAADKLRQDPEMFITPSGYLQFMREAGASGNLLMPPSQIAQLVKDPNSILQLWQGGYHGKKTAPGTVAAAVAGLDSVNAMRDLFIQDGVNLGPTRMITALHHLWGILSRQLDPYNQEALWMRMVSYAPVMEQIQLSIDGKFKLTANEWKQVVQASRKATKGDYQKAGNNATANANAFHHMLSKHNGKWQELANIYKLSDPVEMTNAFWGLGVGATGIKNKVQRFIGLTFGIHGSVLDRWRFVGLNLPTAMGLTGKATPETYFNYYGRNKTIPEDPVGIYKSYGTVENGNPVFSTALYAGIDRAIQGVIDNSKEMRDFLGVHATPGGFHWVDWNCVKNEAVGHSSLDLTKEFLKRKGRNGTVEDFLDVVRTSTTYTRADQDGRIIDLVMKDGIFQVIEQK